MDKCWGESRMIEHIALFKFKPTTSIAERQRLIAHLRQLPEMVEGIVKLAIRRDILGTDDSFDLGLFVTLADRTGLRQYGASQQRQAVSTYARRLCDQVVLFDYELDETE